MNKGDEEICTKQEGDASAKEVKGEENKGSKAEEGPKQKPVPLSKRSKEDVDKLVKDKIHLLKANEKLDDELNESLKFLSRVYFDRRADREHYADYFVEEGFSGKCFDI